MDQEILVRSGRALIELLDKTNVKPRAAMCVEKPETNVWRLWIVSKTENYDKNEFYRVVSTSISENRDKLQNIDISAVDIVSDKHPAIQGLKSYIKLEDLGAVSMSNNTINGFFLPDSIVMRMRA